MRYELFPNYVPLFHFASKSGGVMSPSSYGSAAHVVTDRQTHRDEHRDIAHTVLSRARAVKTKSKDIKLYLTHIYKHQYDP